MLRILHPPVLGFVMQCSVSEKRLEAPQHTSRLRSYDTQSIASMPLAHWHFAISEGNLLCWNCDRKPPVKCDWNNTGHWVFEASTDPCRVDFSRILAAKLSNADAKFAGYWGGVVAHCSLHEKGKKWEDPELAGKSVHVLGGEVLQSLRISGPWGEIVRACSSKAIMTLLKESCQKLGPQPKASNRIWTRRTQLTLQSTYTPKNLRLEACHAVVPLAKHTWP